MLLHHAGSRTDPPFDPTMIRPSVVSTYSNGTRRSVSLRTPMTSRSSTGITNERRMRPRDQRISGPSTTVATPLKNLLALGFFSTPSSVLGIFNEPYPARLGHKNKGFFDNRSMRFRQPIRTLQTRIHPANRIAGMTFSNIRLSFDDSRLSITRPHEANPYTRFSNVGTRLPNGRCR
jgi:hypothetical protein